MTAKILIIEDHSATAQFISEALAIEGFISAIAADGIDGIAKIREENPDLILLDVMLPGQNGFEVCEKLKKDPSTSNIPIIIVSVRGSNEDKKRGFAARCADYIVKPFEPEALIKAVLKVLK